jgi:hypothetical protein
MRREPVERPGVAGELDRPFEQAIAAVVPQGPAHRRDHPAPAQSFRRRVPGRSRRQHQPPRLRRLGLDLPPETVLDPPASGSAPGRPNPPAGSGNPASSPPATRAPNTSPTGSAPRQDQGISEHTLLESADGAGELTTVRPARPGGYASRSVISVAIRRSSMTARPRSAMSEASRGSQGLPVSGPVSGVDSPAASASR